MSAITNFLADLTAKVEELVSVVNIRLGLIDETASAAAKIFSDRAEEAAEEALEAAEALLRASTLVQYSFIATANQTVVTEDDAGTPIIADAGVASIFVNGVGPLTPLVDYTISENGIVTFTKPQTEGDLVRIDLYPRVADDPESQQVQLILDQYRTVVATLVNLAVNRSEAAASSAESDAEIASTVAQSVGNLVGDLENELSYSRTITQQVFVTTAGVTNYYLDTKGQSLGTSGVGHMLFGPTGFLLITGTDYATIPGGIKLASDPGGGYLYKLMKLPKVSGGEATLILQNYKDEVQEILDGGVDRAELAALRSENALNGFKNISISAQMGDEVSAAFDSSTNTIELTIQKGDKGDKGEAFSVSHTGPFSGRSAYDSEAPGFSYLASDTSVLYFRLDPTGWSSGTSFGKGDKGDKGDAGTTDWNGILNKPATYTAAPHVHNQAEITGLATTLATKSDVGHNHNAIYYTKTEIDAMFALLAPKASPAFTGTVSVETLTASGNISAKGNISGYNP